MSDEENGLLENGQSSELSGLPKLTIRHTTDNLPDHLYLKVQIMLKEALAVTGNKAWEKDIARYIKKKLDADPDFNELPGKGPWQVIVGKSYAAAITHEASHVSYFDIGNTRETVLLFKSLAIQSD